MQIFCERNRIAAVAVLLDDLPHQRRIVDVAEPRPSTKSQECRIGIRSIDGRKRSCSLLTLPTFTSRASLCRDPLQQFRRRFVIRILRSTSFRAPPDRG